MRKKTVLVTGSAGFIGAKTSELLLKKGFNVVGIDNVNDYYDVKLKNYRLRGLKKNKQFIFHKTDIENYTTLKKIFDKYTFSAVINLAARAGVRYSMENPFIYMRTNANGTLNLLELCRENKVNKFVVASTSSLYAGNKMPFKETLAVNTPISPYAASKKAAESMCHAYNYLYGIDTTILRYFTVYGPAGRPDMSIFRFIKWMDEGVPLEIFGDGTQGRDFTFIDDIAGGTVKALRRTGFKIINLGGNKPYKLNTAIKLIEKHLGKRSGRVEMPFHIADVKNTWANVREAEKILKWKPKIGLDEGIKRTVQWYVDNRKWLKNVTM